MFCWCVVDVAASGGAMMNESRQELHSHLLSLKQQHQVQQQMLLQHYQESQMRLAQEQEKQMSEHVKVNVCIRAFKLRSF